MRLVPVSLVRSLVVLTLLLFAWHPLVAQTNNGGIAGTILDSSGAVISGAEVTATGAETHTVYTTTSTSTGAYRFLNLVLGTYDISVAAKGFKTAEVKGIVVQINTIASLDITLQAGEVTQTLTVVADAPHIQSETSEVGTVVSSKEIIELPLSLNSSGQSFLRSPETFVFLAPGTQGPGTNQNGSTSSGIFESKLSGGQNFGTEVLLDGVSTTRSDSGSAFDQTAPSVEALSEFKVLTSTFSSQFGRTSGGIESFATKSGTNDYHGTAFDLFRNTALDANSWNNNFDAVPKPPDHQNNFGGNLGGPVRIPKLYDGKDKTFFFFNWEQYRNNPGTVSSDTLPTQAELQNGDFSALLGAPTGATNPCDNTPVLKGQIFNPNTTSCPTGFVGGRVAFPGNIVPTSMFDPVAKKILSFLTVSANPQAGLQNNFIFLSSQKIRDTTMTFRIDQNWGPKNKFFFSYSSRDQGTPAGTDDLPGPLDGNFHNINFTHYLRFGWDYTISTNWLNSFTIGFNRLNNQSKANSVNGTNWPSVLGIGNASGLVFPSISFNGSPDSIAYTGFSTESDNGHVPNSLVTADNVSWVHGRHFFHFGGEWRAYQYSFIAAGDTSPNYGFNNFQTAFAPNDTTTGDPFASFLLGLPQSEQETLTSVNPRLNSNYFAGFVQDDFKIRRDLTLNLGLRYDVDTPRHEAHNAVSALDLTAPNSGTTTGTNPIPIVPSVPGALIYGHDATGAKIYYKDLGPRVGFAYAPDQLFGRIRNIVFRGGYAIYYAALFYDDLPTGAIQFSSGTTSQPGRTSQNNFTPVQALSAGFPTGFAPPQNSTNPALLNGLNVGYMAPSYGRPARTQNWSLETQKQLATDLILSVGYVGIKGDYLHTNIAQVNALNPTFYHLGTALADNPTSPAGMAALASVGVNSLPSWFEPLYGPSGPTGGNNNTVAQVLRPFPQYLDIGGSNNNMCSCLENLGISTYNALQVKLERRFRNGLNLLASYTFSKTLTNADSAIPVFSGFQSNEFAAQNPFNPQSQKALSFQDTPHMLVLSYLYELPAGPGKKYLNHGVASKVLGGWEIGGVQRYQSGTPTIFSTNAESPTGTDGAFRYDILPGVPLLAPNHASFNPFLTLPAPAGTAPHNVEPSGCNENPDGTFSPQHATDPTGKIDLGPSTNNFFNCAAFFDPNAPNLVAKRGYVYGTAPLVLGNLRSQHYFNEDFSILKRTAFHENQAIVFKVDIPNAFNRHVFGTLDGSIADFDSTSGAPKGFSVVSPTRQIQLTLRYEF